MKTYDWRVKEGHFAGVRQNNGRADKYIGQRTLLEECNKVTNTIFEQ